MHAPTQLFRRSPFYQTTRFYTLPAKKGMEHLLNEKFMPYVRVMVKDAFDPGLWLSLQQKDLCDYHHRLDAILKPGYLWLQEDTYQGAALHWKNPQGGIYRAHFSYDHHQMVSLHSFDRQDGRFLYRKQSFSLEEFHNFLSKDMCWGTDAYSLKQCDPQQETALLQKRVQLEVLPLICSLSRDVFSSWPPSAPDLCATLYMGIASPRVNGRFHLGKAHLQLGASLKKGREGGTSDAQDICVLPVLQSWHAYRQIQSAPLHAHQNKRWVCDFSSFSREEKAATRSLEWKDLTFWLSAPGVSPGLHTFEKKPIQRHFQEKWELIVDYKKGAWQLQSQYYTGA